MRLDLCRIWLCLLLASALSVGLPGTPQAQNPETPPSPTANLDFLLGEWNLDTWFIDQQGSKRKGKAKLTVTTTLGGAGIEFRSHYPENEFFAVRTFVFNQRLGEWIGSGINSLGNAKQYAATLEGKSFVTIQTGMLFEGRPGRNRATYFDVTEDSFKLRHEHSPDDGKTWEEPKFGYSAQRRPK